MAESQSENPNTMPESFALHEDLVNFVLHALEERDTPRVQSLVSGLHQGDMAELLHLLSQDERKLFVESIRDTLDPELLVWLEGEVREEVIAHLGAEDSAAAIGQLEHDDALQVIEDLDDENQSQILEGMSDEFRKELEQGLALPEDAAGRIMDTCFVALPAEWSVGQVIDFLRSEDEEDLPDDFYSIYLTDAKKHPIGSVLVSRVMRNRREVLLKDIMEQKLYKVNATTDQEEVAHLFKKYALVSMPVVDAQGVIAGVISIDDIVDVIEEEAEEDILRMGGLGGDTDLYSPLMQTVKSRLPWLFINLLTAIAASKVIAGFAGDIEKLVALAVLMPIVASMAGNAGMQTLTVAVRGIAMKDLTSANAGRLVKKELLTGMLNGLMLGIVMVGGVWLVYSDMRLGLIFGAAIVACLAIANLAGAVIPLWLAKANIDPAISSAIVLTTVTDISGFFIFLGMASLWLL